MAPTVKYNVLDESSDCDEMGMQEYRTSPVVKISSSNLKNNVHFIVKSYHPIYVLGISNLSQRFC
jgi:hypothetical protein